MNLAQKLRNIATVLSLPSCNDAADEIERLTKQRDELTDYIVDQAQKLHTLELKNAELVEVLDALSSVLECYDLPQEIYVQISDSIARNQ